MGVTLRGRPQWKPNPKCGFVGHLRKRAEMRSNYRKYNARFRLG